jgi:TRAP-type mannitol/chloroaromatic compound transport system permease small subunit
VSRASGGAGAKGQPHHSPATADSGSDGPAPAPPRALLLTIRVIDRVVGEWSGRLFCWLIIPLVGGLTYEVLVRYLFNAPTIWAYDVTYMLYGAHFMLGAAHTLYSHGHIRTDIFYDKWSPRTQGTIDAVLYLFLFFPGMFFFLTSGWEEALLSISVLETSDASPWRPPLYPFKTVIPVAAALLLVQGVSEFLKSVYAARWGRWL